MNDIPLNPPATDRRNALDLQRVTSLKVTGWTVSTSACFAALAPLNAPTWPAAAALDRCGMHDGVS